MWTSSAVPFEALIETPGGPPTRPDFAPSGATVAGPLVVGIVLGLAALDLDTGGRLLIVPAALVLLALGLRDALLRPTLALRHDGLDVVVGGRRRHVPWAELEGVRVVTDRRATLLELDLGFTVVVLSRRRLGVPPDVALEVLEQVRAGR